MYTYSKNIVSINIKVFGKEVFMLQPNFKCKVLENLSVDCSPLMCKRAEEGVLITETFISKQATTLKRLNLPKRCLKNLPRKSTISIYIITLNFTDSYFAIWYNQEHLPTYRLNVSIHIKFWTDFKQNKHISIKMWILYKTRLYMSFNDLCGHTSF